MTCSCLVLAIGILIPIVSFSAEKVPVVTLAMADASRPVELLKRGRSIYVSQCARCHSAQPVLNYSQEQWDRLLPEMEKQSRLSTNQVSELRAYILQVRSITQTGFHQQPPTEGKVK
jgi:mono/diheme cytochrome c family protein